jgi:hypothetical protein
MSTPDSSPFVEASSTSWLSRWLGSLTEIVLFAVVFLMPLWFLPQTLDLLELNKQTLLLIGAMVGALAWFGKILAERRAKIAWNWLHIAVGLYIAGYLVVSLAAPDRYLALAGNIGQMPWAFATMLGFAVMYVLIAVVPRDVSRVYRLVFAFLGSSTVVSGWRQSSRASATSSSTCARCSPRTRPGPSPGASRGSRERRRHGRPLRHGRPVPVLWAGRTSRRPGPPP